MTYLVRFICFSLMVILIGCGITTSYLSAEPTEGSELIGTQPSEWTVNDWINSEPLELNDLKGKVVLVRFWTGPECPFCRASVPALNEFYEKYHDQGLEVIGLYHHKSPTPSTKTHVQDLVEKYQFKFPVAIDYNWKMLRNWWLDAGDQRWTSVSFLIDKKGIIRHIHPGGQYVKGDQDYAQIESKIIELLGESV
ncbi:MAG: TlpA family protein disulfide reductase [Candidatus Omnitrophica bacterium]|nr:TlpA family protein disulfide reductase [Candidatus Omnitrophota bacterium]